MKGILILSLAYSLLYCSEADSIIANILAPKDTLAPAQIAGVSDAFEKPPVVLDANKTVSAPKFSLKAIFEGGALINGRWLRLGDTVNGYRIEKIDKNKVFLVNGKKQKTLHIFKGGK